MLVLDADLLARARIEEAVRAAGATLQMASSESPLPDLTEVSAIVLDLDRGREPALDFIARARENGFSGDVFGFFSHVDEALGSAAEAAGVRALPRGRFWRELPSLLGAR